VVVPAAQRGQQADARGPVQQPDPGLTVQPGQFRHRVLPGGDWVAHEAQGVGACRVAEQVQYGQPRALGIGERLGEPVAQRGGQGAGAAQRGVLRRLELRLPGPQPVNEILDACAVGHALVQRLADDHGDGQRIAGRVPQQRPPVRGGQPDALPGRQLRGQLRAFAHRHGREADPGGQVAEPGALVTAGCQQHLALGVLRQVAQQLGQVLLLGGRPRAGGAPREPGDRLDVVPDPQRRHLRQDLQHDGPALGRVGQRRPGDSAGLQRRGELVADSADGAVGGQVVLERGPQHGAWPLRVIQAAGVGVPAGELRRGRGLASPGERMQQDDGLAVEGTIQGQQRLIPAEEARVRGAWQDRRRPGTGRGVQYHDRRGALGRAQQDQRRGLVDHGDGPVLQLDRCRRDLPDRIVGKCPPGRRRGPAQGAAGQQARVEVGEELGGGVDVDVVPHRDHAVHARVGDLGGQGAVGADPGVDIARHLARLLAGLGVGRAARVQDQDGDAGRG
jgi:hypothetical protein